MCGVCGIVCVWCVWVCVCGVCVCVWVCVCVCVWVCVCPWGVCVCVATHTCRPLGFGTVWYDVLFKARHTLKYDDVLSETSVFNIHSNVTTCLVDNSLYSYIKP